MTCNIPTQSFWTLHSYSCPFCTRPLKCWLLIKVLQTTILFGLLVLIIVLYKSSYIKDPRNSNQILFKLGHRKIFPHYVTLTLNKTKCLNFKLNSGIPCQLFRELFTLNWNMVCMILITALQTYPTHYLVRLHHVVDHTSCTVQIHAEQQQHLRLPKLGVSSNTLDNSAKLLLISSLGQHSCVRSLLCIAHGHDLDQTLRFVFHVGRRRMERTSWNKTILQKYMENFCFSPWNSL